MYYMGEEKMKKNIYRKSIVIGFVFAFLAAMPAHNRAVASQNQGVFVGELCCRLEPFIDTLKLTVEKEGEFYIIYGRWMAERLYSIAIVGSAVRDDVDGEFDFMFTGSDQLDLGYIWHFHAKIDRSMNGSWTFSRDDDFTNSGTLTSIECTADMAMSGPSANDPY
jgi:hypothetical protein